MSTTDKSNLLENRSDDTNPAGDAEDRVLQLQKELEYNNRFISIFSHDLRNMFNQVLGGLEVLENYYRNLTDDQARKMLKLTRRSAEEVNATFESMLLWAKSGAGELPFNPEVLSLKEQLDKMVDQFQLGASVKNVALRCRLEEDVMISADRHMLNCILVNLVCNAIKFTASGGEVLLDGRFSDDHSEIFVTDSGKCLSAKQKEKLSGNDKPPAEAQNNTGAGIGLLICRDFVGTHRGWMKVVSERDSGTHIIVALPHFFPQEN